VVTIGNVDLVFSNSTLLPRTEAAARTGGLEVRGVRYVVDNGKQLLDNISMTARPGTLTAIIGGSGAGKSTLARLIAGYIRPGSGSVTFEGHDIHTEYASLRSRIGMVPQDDVVHRQLTVNQALGYAAELRLPPDTSKSDRARIVAQVLEELDLTKHADTRVDKLSGGQRKRASVALELLTGPSLLILDEPTSGLDPADPRRTDVGFGSGPGSPGHDDAALARRRRPRGDRGDAHVVLPRHLRPAAAGGTGRQDGLLRLTGPDR
jgi:ABC-type multidrug transport system fused ATPase/permease subunit